jgi:hypothetical protein
MTPQVLIFSPTDDAHATAVAWALRERGIGTVLAPSIRIDQGTKMAVWMNMDGLRTTGTVYSQDCDIRSVWYRRPRPPEAGTCHDADRNFIAGQWLRLQNNVFGLAENLLKSLWVNNPDMADRAENKLVQMHVAQQVGLELPDTVITNDAQDVRTLLRRWPKVIFKTFYRITGGAPPPATLTT